MPEIRKALDQMIVLDYLLVNEDRHLNNFGVVRKAESLKYMCAAPIFDSGTSMWFDKPTAMIGDITKLVCKPFKNTHEEQIKLVSSFEWLAMEKLSGIEEEFREIVRGSLFVDEKRCDALCAALKNRVKMLEKVIHANQTVYTIDDYKNDVKENIAYSGSGGYKKGEM